MVVLVTLSLSLTLEVLSCRVGVSCVMSGVGPRPQLDCQADFIGLSFIDSL